MGSRRVRAAGGGGGGGAAAGTGAGDGGRERGDQLVRLIVVLPERPDPELTDFLRRWAQSHDYEVRAAEPDATT